MHDRNIVHRDIKIENILMSDNTAKAEVRIADMGSAVKLNSAAEKLTFKIGTPGYVAPEILEGKPYSFPVDIWSLGCLMHLLIGGNLPFWTEDRNERITLVCNDEPLDMQN